MFSSLLRKAADSIDQASLKVKSTNIQRKVGLNIGKVTKIIKSSVAGLEEGFRTGMSNNVIELTNEQIQQRRKEIEEGIK